MSRSSCLARVSSLSVRFSPVYAASATQSTRNFANIPTAETPGKGQLDPLLFTPGPLTTSYSVKAAMLHDLGSRDQKFLDTITDIRSGLLDVANVSSDDWTSIPVQGSGTFAVEATVTSVVPKDGGKLLVVANGAYGARIATMAQYAGIDHEMLTYSEDTPPDLNQIDQVLGGDKFTHVVCVHSETTSGIINPVEQVGEVCHRHGASFIVDAMSSFGGVPVDLEKGRIDYLVSSANKCIEGVPGFAFCIARRSALDASEGNARSLSLDIHSQNKGLNANGQFRFTPPTHTMLAFRQALAELAAEGGVAGRAARYTANRDLVFKEMLDIGFEPYLTPGADSTGYIITSFKYPESPNWDFETFYRRLAAHKCLIYPGKVTNANCFRIGHIGRLFPEDTAKMMKALRQISDEMQLF